VGLLVRKNELAPIEIYTHPERNAIYRYLGDTPQLVVDTFLLNLEPNDRLVLCCDGLWEMVRDEGIEQVLCRISDNPSTQPCCG
jgi:serine/threonine protein phosphatase PrpC